MIAKTPATNPPTCAQKAMPPVVWEVTVIEDAVPLKNWTANQYPSMSQAGTWKKKMGGNHVRTRALG